MWKLIRRVLLALVVLVVILNWTWGRLPSTPPAPSGSKFAQVGDKRIHYMEKPGREPAVLMIHGLPGTYGDWQPVQSVTEGRRTISIDRPGYAYSSDGYVAFADQVKLLHALADELKLERPVIAGHSYGGSLALAYGLQYPEDTRAIVAVDPGVNGDDISSMDMGRAGFALALQQPVIQPIANLTFSQAAFTFSGKTGAKEAFDPDPVTDGYEERLLAVNMKRPDLSAYGHEYLDLESAYRGFQDRLRELKRPVFMIQGRDDKLVPTTSVRAAAKTIPRVKYRELAGGHMQPYTHPREVANFVAQAAAVK